MVKEIITYPSSFLRKPTKPVSIPVNKELILKIITDSLDTMYNRGEALAIAANQIGYSTSLFVVNPETKENQTLVEEFGIVFINPQILWYSPEKEIDYEGCLSVPNINLPVSRSIDIEILFFDLNGNCHKQKFTKLYSRMIQHECDHLSGKLFIDLIGKK